MAIIQVGGLPEIKAMGGGHPSRLCLSSQFEPGQRLGMRELYDTMRSAWSCSRLASRLLLNTCASTGL